MPVWYDELGEGVAGSRKAVFHRLVSKRYRAVWGWGVEGSDGVVDVYATAADAVRESMAAGFAPVLPDNVVTALSLGYPRGYEDRGRCVKVWEDEIGQFWWEEPSVLSTEDDGSLSMSALNERGPYGSEREAAEAVRDKAAERGLDWGDRWMPVRPDGSIAAEDGRDAIVWYPKVLGGGCVVAVVDGSGEDYGDAYVEEHPSRISGALACVDLGVMLPIRAQHIDAHKWGFDDGSNFRVRQELSDSRSPAWIGQEEGKEPYFGGYQMGLESRGYKSLEEAERAVGRQLRDEGGGAEGLSL